ncbi:hypothetical protein [Nostoc sp. TCL26-01]|uniref:hypothetical protein n=1 Tax=Nostoc sp. TCL26-01 TaxID=2576904 RepID=UPI0015B91B96|nr:hypothetical protein [Nostoc sp. TCL26-01]QLE56045.1 hypothetical protein FD725_11220 [Nostoc sp. TCL26-01]
MQKSKTSVLKHQHSYRIFRKFSLNFDQQAPKHDRHAIAQALQNSVSLYQQLRDRLKLPDLIVRSPAEIAATQYLQQVIDNF